jgi:hypothetical protein
MILKMRRDDTTWVYLDKIRNISVDVSRDYALTILENKEKSEKWIEVCGLSENSDKDSNREICENSKFIVDQYLLEPQEILKQAIFNDKGKRQFWGVKLMAITYQDGSLLTAAALTSNDNIYLLNDDGKTIERI